MVVLRDYQGQVNSPLPEQVPQWPPIIGIGQTNLNLPEFNIQWLPEQLCRFVDGIGQSLQVKSDSAAMLALSVASYCLCRHNIIQPKPDYTEQMNLYVCAVMPASTRKSAIHRILIEPLWEYEQILIQEQKAAVAKNKAQKRALEKRQRILEDKLAKDPDDNDLQAELDKINMELSNYVDLHLPTVIVGDCTAESVGRLLAQNNGKLGLFSSEGGIFSTLSGRYSSGIPNFEILLKAYSGDHYKLHRIGREPEVIKCPCLAIGLTVQPAVFDNLKCYDYMNDTGLLGRFLYTAPEDI